MARAAVAKTCVLTLGTNSQVPMVAPATSHVNDTLAEARTLVD